MFFFYSQYTKSFYDIIEHKCYKKFKHNLSREIIECLILPIPVQLV